MENTNIGLYRLQRGGYQLSYIGHSGRRTRRKFHSFRQARNHQDQIARVLAANLPDSLALQPIASLVKTHLEQNPNSPMNNRGPWLFESFIKNFGGKLAAEISTSSLAAWLDEIKREKSYGGRTMLQCKYAFTPFFDDLVDRGVLKVNPLALVKIKKGTRLKEKVYLSEPDLKQILEKLREVSTDLTYPVIYFMLHTGCKIGEALSLTWDRVNLATGTVHFLASPSAAERTVRLSPRLLDFLKTRAPKADHVFLDADAKSCTSGKFGKRIARDRAHADLGKLWDTYAFRHTFAYHFLREGGTLQQLQVVLGHRNISDTMAAYGTIMSRKKEKLSPY